MTTDKSRADALTDEYYKQVWKRVNGTHPYNGMFGRMVADFARALLAASPVEQPAAAPIHSDDACVDQFAASLKSKLALARAKGRGGWESCDPADLSRMLREHVEKGDPRDVANFCMFLWALGKPISAAALPAEKQPAPSPADERAAPLEHDFQVDRASGIEICTRCGLGRIAARRSPVCGTPTVHDAFEAWLKQPHPNNWNDCNHPLTIGERQAARLGWEAALQWQAHAASANETGAEGLAHEVWAAAQIAPGEGIEDGTRRVAAILSRAPAQAAEPMEIYQILTEEGAWLDTTPEYYARVKSDPALARVVYSAPRSAQADARVGLTDEQREALQHAINAAEEDCAYTTATTLRALLAAHPGQPEPIAWESTTVAYTKYITDERYQKFSPEVRKWYKPYRCSACQVPRAEAADCGCATNEACKMKTDGSCWRAD